MQESIKIKCLFFTPEDFDSLVGEANHHIPSMAAALANQKILKLVQADLDDVGERVLATLQREWFRNDR